MSGVNLMFANNVIIKPRFKVDTDRVLSFLPNTILSYVYLKVFPCVAFNEKCSIDKQRFGTKFELHSKNSNSIKALGEGIILQITISKVEDEKIDLIYTYYCLPHADDPLRKPNWPDSSAIESPPEFYTEVESFEELKQPFTSVYVFEKLKHDQLLHQLMRNILVD